MEKRALSATGLLLWAAAVAVLAGIPDQQQVGEQVPVARIPGGLVAVAARVVVLVVLAR